MACKNAQTLNGLFEIRPSLDRNDLNTEHWSVEWDRNLDRDREIGPWKVVCWIRLSLDQNDPNGGMSAE